MSQSDTAGVPPAHPNYPICTAYDEAEHPEDVTLFVSLSCELTGFDEVDIYGTGQVLTYFRIVGDYLKSQDISFRSLFSELPGSLFSEENEAFLRDLFEQAGPGAKLAASIIKLWYLGQWYNPDNSDDTWIPSANSYASGLVWDAIHAHPQGAKQQGFAAWSFPPSASATVSP